MVQVCLITGGDSGIGRSVALMYAREGAKAIAITYLNEERDAEVSPSTLSRFKNVRVQIAHVIDHLIFDCLKQAFFLLYIGLGSGVRWLFLDPACIRVCHTLQLQLIRLAKSSQLRCAGDKTSRRRGWCQSVIDPS